MKNTLFIQANTKQMVGALLAKFAAERQRKDPNSFDVQIINVETVPAFKEFAWAGFKRGNETRVQDPNDLQSFTLTRLMPPELMGYEGRAVVIDPDIFALKDIAPLFEMDLKGNTLAACPKKSAWDSSVMVLDCAKLTHWKIADILKSLGDGTDDYRTWMQLRAEKNVFELSRDWNSLDVITPTTGMLHTTVRLTQPWKTGLPIDFTPGHIPPLFGYIPRFWVKQPTHYQPHPDPAVENFFFKLTKDALAAGAVTNEDLQAAIDAHNVRADLFKKISAA